MLAALKSEYLKLVTIRSTYIISGLALAFIVFLSFFIEGFKGASGSAASMGAETAFAEMIMNVGGLASAFGALVVILLAAHEYRHNTIVYTLTAANNRTKVLLAKIAVTIGYSLAFLAIAIGVGIGSYALGMAVTPRLVELAPQTVELAMVGRLVFYMVGMSLMALLITFLVRHLVGAIAIIFMVPNTVEPLLGLLLKENAVYLPFSVFNQVLMPGQQMAVPGSLSAGTAIYISLLYLVVGWFIAWALFMRRDAN